MSFFKDFKEDLLQAADELIFREDNKETAESKKILENYKDLLETDEEAVVFFEAERVEEVQEDDEKESIDEYQKIIVAKERKTESEDKGMEVTTISKGVHLEGNFRAEGSVNLLGSVVGDLECDGKLVINGIIKGNAKAAEVYANNARVEGDIVSGGSIKVGTGSVIIGSIVASSAVIGGAIKGDIDVKGPVIVDSTAVVYGNIKSRSVQLNNGAVLEGYVSQCYADVDVKALFDVKDAK